MVANTADMIGRMVKPETPDLSPETAREFLDWNFTDADRERVQELVDKNNANMLSHEERSELNTYMVLGDLLNLLHAKAHLSLHTQSQAS